MKAEIQGVTIETNNDAEDILTIVVSKNDVTHSVINVPLDKPQDNEV
jgi:hypothetical protein